MTDENYQKAKHMQANYMPRILDNYNKTYFLENLRQARPVKIRL